MNGDVPSPIDLRRMSDAAEWEQSAMSKRPWRTEFFAQFAIQIASAPRSIHRVLEIGSGPGFLAKHLLEALSGISYVLLDFSPAMHELARSRLTGLENKIQFIERDFKQEDWYEGLSRFDCVVTHQAVHELRHKRHATQLHSQVRGILEREGLYLVCDHFVGDGGMTNPQLYMSVEEQKQALLAAGFTQVEEILTRGGLVLHRAT
jgi:ubiquinone/menaquinone biosynthesis C-methylase UbiE